MTVFLNLNYSVFKPFVDLLDTVEFVAKINSLDNAVTELLLCTAQAPLRTVI